MKILIVEDDLERALILKKYLQSNSVEVFTAEDGFDAMKILKKQKVDLILSDANMPYMDGFALAKNVKSVNETKMTPFFLYSSRRLNEPTRELAADLGVDRCINDTDMDEIGFQALAYLKAI